MLDELSLSRKVLFILVTAGLVVANLYLFVANVRTYQHAQSHPLSQVTLDSKDPVPPFGFGLQPQSFTPLRLSSIDCYTQAINYNATNGRNYPAGPRTPCTLMSSAPQVFVTFDPSVFQSTPNVALVLNFDWAQIGGSCMVVYVYSETQILTPDQIIDFNLPTNKVVICPNVTYVFEPSLMITTYLNSTTRYGYSLYSSPVSPAWSTFGSSVELYSEFIDFEVSVNTLVIGYSGIDLLAATAGLLSMSLSIWMFLFPSVPAVEHKRWFVLDHWHRTHAAGAAVPNCSGCCCDDGDTPGGANGIRRRLTAADPRVGARATPDGGGGSSNPASFQPLHDAKL